MADNLIPIIRVFVSSPGDMIQERNFIANCIKKIENQRPYRNKFKIVPILWERPENGTVMPAHITPQEAINRGLPLPSQCDIVIVLFWSRMGSPLEHDKVDYLSGTHWELLDALKSTTTTTVIYRRTEKKVFEGTDTEGKAQYQRLTDFFESDFFRKDGKYIRQANEYPTFKYFKVLFEENLKELIDNILEKKPTSDAVLMPCTPVHIPTKPNAIKRILPFIGVIAMLFLGGLALFSVIPRPTPPITATAPVVSATPTKYPIEEFVVAVAGLGFDDGSGKIRQDALADELAQDLFRSLADITKPQYLISPDIIGHILEQSPEGRATRADEIAEMYNIDVVIYGVVSQDAEYIIYSPALAFNASWVNQEPELFGEPPKIELLRGGSLPSVTQLQAINPRLKVIELFLKGLEYYLIGDYITAYTYFEQSTQVDITKVETSAYIYMANAASRATNYADALAALDVVFEEDRDNPRALYARGNALLNMAAYQVEYYDPLLDLDGETCLSELPHDRRRLALMAIECFQEATRTPTASTVLQIPLRAYISIGQANLFLADLPAGEQERWQTALDSFNNAILLFRDLPAQSGLNYFGGLAYLGYGDAGYFGEISRCADVLGNYEQALTLLEGGSDRSDYVKETIIAPLKDKITQLDDCSQ